LQAVNPSPPVFLLPTPLVQQIHQLDDATQSTPRILQLKKNSAKLDVSSRTLNKTQKIRVLQLNQRKRHQNAWGSKMTTHTEERERELDLQAFGNCDLKTVVD
jgi:hypothetical protein